MTFERFGRGVFYAVLLIAPLFWGSVYLWSLAPLAGMLLGLGCVAIWELCSGRFDVYDGWRYGRWVGLLLAISVFWTWLQVLPIPDEWLKAVSPFAAGQYADLADAVSRHPISLNVGEGKRQVLLGFTYVWVYVLTLLLFRTREQVKWLCWTIIASGIFQALYGSAMVLSGLEWSFLKEKAFYRGVATGTLINRNHLAGYLEMTIAVGIGLMLMEKAGDFAGSNWRGLVRSVSGMLLSWKAGLRLGLVVMVIGLVMTRSRMGNAAFFFSLITTGAALLMLDGAQRREAATLRISKVTVALLFLSIVLVDIAVVSNWFGLEQLASRIEQTATSGAGDRGDIDKLLIPITRVFWLTGSGAGSFQSVFPAFVSEGENQNLVNYDYDHAHNDVLEFLLERGVIGFAPLALAVCGSLLAGLRLISSSKSQMAKGCGVAGFMGTLSLMIHSTSDFNLQIPSNAMLFMVILALPWVGISINRQPKA